MIGVNRTRLDVHCCDSEVYPSCGVARRNRRFRVRVSDESNECCEDDVEAMISFLSEELVGEGRNCSRVEEKREVIKVEAFGRVKREGVERPQGFGRQEYRRNGVRENVKLEEKKYECEHCGGRKKKSQLESETRRGSKLVTGGGENLGGRKKEKFDQQGQRVRVVHRIILLLLLGISRVKLRMKKRRMWSFVART